MNVARICAKHGNTEFGHFDLKLRALGKKIMMVGSAKKDDASTADDEKKFKTKTNSKPSTISTKQQKR